jgi:7,8-dihydropterin-6-yl-methyl-4-(beta-D-ribofuranosyl)aminobenzene 5'-phosphate synthase
MIKGLKIRVVVEDTASQIDARLWSQHGLSFFLEVDLGPEKMRILMDTGASPEVTLHNFALLEIDPADLDMIILSHGHYDHTGGLVGVLEDMHRPIPVLAHPQIFSPKMKISPFLKYIGLPFSRAEAEASGAVFLPSRSPVPLAEGLTTTGEVKRDEPLETVEGFWTIREGKYCQDNILDDQSLAAHVEGKGLVVISGCAHAGIINTVRQAQRIIGTQEVCAVIGGFHLSGASPERVEATAKSLQRFDPKVVRPGHCTGRRAISRLQEVLGDRCQPLACGDAIDL